MNLKRAFTLRKYLGNLIDTAYDYLQTTDNITDTTEFHEINIANPDCENKVIVKDEHEYISADVIKFASVLYSEIKKLDAAIAEAKNDGDNYDVLVANNNTRRNFIAVLTDLANEKEERRSETTSIGRKLNADGEQVQFVYNVAKTRKINYDRENVKRMLASERAIADVISEELDKILVTRGVSFQSIFVVGESFEDAMNRAILRN